MALTNLKQMAVQIALSTALKNGTKYAQPTRFQHQSFYMMVHVQCSSTSKYL